jgi:Tol biopolymer transport system component
MNVRSVVLRCWLQLILVTAVVLCACVGLIVFIARAEAPRWLAFIATPDRDTSTGLYVVRADGVGLRRIAELVTFTPPVWSADGEWLTFVRARGDDSGGIFRIRADGSGEQRITAHNAFRLEWSPDGAWLYFVGGRTGGVNLYRVRPNGDALEQLTHFEAVSLMSFALSPIDGRVAFSVVGFGHDDAAFETGLYLLGADAPELLIGSGAFDSQSSPIELAWSPDGSRLATSVTMPGGQHLYLVSLDEPRRLPLAQGKTPVWVDESSIAYVDFARNYPYANRMYQVNTDDGSIELLSGRFNQLRVSHPINSMMRPALSPAGDIIAFIRSYGQGMGRLFVMRVNGKPFGLTDVMNTISMPVWSPTSGR